MKTTITSGQLTKMLQLFDQWDVVPEKFQVLLESGIFPDVLEADLRTVNRDAVREALKMLPKTFDVYVDLGASIHDMLTAGQYDHSGSEVWREVLKKYPSSRGGKWCTMELVCFHREMTLQDAITNLKIRGLSPGNTRDLMAFGSAHPSVQRKLIIVAPDSLIVVKRPKNLCNDKYISVLHGDDSQRILSTGQHHNTDEIYKEYYFLAVRN